MSEAVVLCEGYHDRDFWAGWLEHLGCPEPEQGKVVDSQGEPVKGHGQFGYWTPSRRFVRIVPCHGKENVLRDARRRIGARRVDPVPSHVVLCIDPDASDGPSTATGLRTEDVLREVRAIDADAKQNEAGDIELDAGATKVMLARWEVPNVAAAGVPVKQTLERLVCSALVTAYPARGPAVAAWLAARPDAPGAGPKEHAWSHMAGWYAKFGCSAFYKALWSDAKIVAELEARLKSCGAWRVAEELLK